MRVPCIKCKGSNPSNCGRSFCPLLLKSESMYKVKSKLNNLKQDFQGSSPAVFVGRFGYPNINVGLLTPPEIKEDAWRYDAPQFWSNNNYQIPELIDLRSSLLNNNFKTNILSARKQDKYLQIGQEVSMASKPVDLEVNLKNKPIIKTKFETVAPPMGPNAILKNVQITSNPKIHTKVDRVVSDIDLKANEALKYLYKNKFDENHLTKILSVGNLGLKKNRKLVPTRWSTTAVHSLIANNIITKIKDYSFYDYYAYFGSYIGNYYLILFFPEIWSYELFEMYNPKTSWNISKEIQYTTDYEPYDGRKKYAENCAGGFYSVRMATAEHLKKLKKQASCLVIRVITGEYACPLGVWVTTSSARKALENKPIKFSSMKLMLTYAEKLIKKKFNFDISNILKKSILLKNLKQQSK
ncbi:hypothetical protein ACFL1H_02705, partial [Nanoarchaeota archaeon]